MKRITSIIVYLLLFGYYAIAQDIQVTGKVTSAEDGSILPGVSVYVKGTTTGTTTDINGSYTMKAPADAILVYSFVGMKTVEVAVNSQNSIDIVMEPDVTGLDEVIVVGYGVSTREANTGSVSVVKGDELADVSESSFEKLLVGKVAGMQITSESGQPGAASQVRIRGISSINAGREPLYVIDGIPLIPSQDPDSEEYYYSLTNTGNNASIINPNDIESISVLKDAAAAAIYGSRAANGVILISTKKGTEGKTTINFRTKYGFSALANDNGFNVLSPKELVALRRDAVWNLGLDPSDPSSGAYYVPDSLLQLPMNNWLKELTKTGMINEYELSMTGGNEKTRHFTSAKYKKMEGVFHGVDFKSYQIRSNLDKTINDRLSAGVKMSAFHSEMNDIAMQSLYYVNPIFGGMAINPFSPVYNKDGTYNIDITEWSNTNPRASAKYDDQWEKKNRLLGAASIEWMPVKNLKLKTNNGVEYTSSESRRYWSPEADANGEATLQVIKAEFSQITSSNTATYNTLVDDHSINAVAGIEILDYRDNYYFVYSPDVSGDIPYVNTSPSDQDDADYVEARYTMTSFFGILDYNFASKYFFRASYRKDGSSKFGDNYKWGNFYSIGASWNIHNEAFMSNISLLDLLKLRISYGLSGNDDIGFYEHWGTYADVQYNGIVGMGTDQPANQDLTWENNAEYNFALDFGFLNKFSGTIEYYDRLTSDMLLNVPLSRTSGFTELRQNVGSLRNRGVEFLFNANILNTNIVWNAGFNLAHNKSKIIDLYIEEGEFLDADNNRLIYREEEQILSYYLYDYAGVNPVNGEALWYNEDGDITNSFSDARRKIMGSPEPKLIGGFNTDVGYRGFKLAVNFEFKYGNDVLIEELHYMNSDGYWFTRNQVNTQMDYWKEPGDITRNPKPIADNTTSSNAYRNPRWMFDGSYLRVKNLTLSYNFPESIISRVKLSNLRLYTSALNLYTFHDVDWWDPERGEDGMGFGIYPVSKSIIFGLDLSF